MALFFALDGLDISRLKDVITVAVTILMLDHNMLVNELLFIG
jgi:hypothetical protein